MGAFTYGGKTPKKIMYNGAEVKRILFNGVEVWHKAEPGSKTVIIDRRGQSETVNYVTPEGITELKLYYCNADVTIDYSKPKRTFKVTTGEKKTFKFYSFYTGPNSYLIQYKVDNESPVTFGYPAIKFVLTWS